MEPSKILEGDPAVHSTDAVVAGQSADAEGKPVDYLHVGTDAYPHSGDGDVQPFSGDPKDQESDAKLTDATSATQSGELPLDGDLVGQALAPSSIHSSPNAPAQELTSLTALMNDKKVTDRQLVDSAFNSLVGGLFDVETNFIIKDIGQLLQLRDFIETCTEKLQAEIWSILNGLLRKSRLNQLICTEAHFIEYILHRLQIAATSNLVADLLLDMLTILASYSITVKELQLLLSHLRVMSSECNGGADAAADRSLWPRHTIHIIQALRQMPHKRGCDEYFCFPGLQGAAIALPPVAASRWPYQNGWTFSTWIYIDVGSSCSDNPSAPYLYCFQTKHDVGYTAHIVGSSLVVTCTRVKGKGLQHHVQYDFQPRQWYMITIAHVYNRWKASLVRCYINKELVSMAEFPWAFTLSEPFDRCYFGSCANLSSQGAFCGQMSALYVFGEALQSNIVEALYALGPSYKGQFKFDSECAPQVEERYRKVLFDGKVMNSVVLMYSPTACHSNICLESSPKGNTTVFAQAPHAMMIGGVKAVLARSVHSALHSLGGIQVIYPLFGQLECGDLAYVVNGGADLSSHNPSIAICSALMALVCDLLETSSTMQQQMALSRGFLVIGHYLEKANPEHLSMDVLDCFIRLANFLMSPTPTVAPHCDTLLKQLNDYIFFNPALWINAPVKVQLVLYHYLATQYLEEAPLFASPARRVSTVIQIFNAFKYYYYLANPLEKSGFAPKVTGQARPSAQDLVRLRSAMLLFIENLVGHYGGVMDDEMESILNYLTVINEVDNVYDVLCMCVVFMDKYAASMVPVFDRKHGVQVLFKLLASPSEALRVQALKLLAFFLARSTARRKSEAMLTHNLFSLLSEHLLLHAKYLSFNIYSCLLEILTERVSSSMPATLESRPVLDLSCRIENPAILKVISSLIKHSVQNEEVLEVRQLFLTDLLYLCENSPENRRCVLQMSVWQDWLFALAYVYPGDSVQEAVTADVLAIFRILLFHAIRVEYGGWRVWIDTMAIVHARVSHEDFQIHVVKLQQQQQALLQNYTDSEKQQAAQLAKAGAHPFDSNTIVADGAILAEAHNHDESADGTGNVNRSHTDAALLATSTTLRPRITFTAAPRSAPFRIPEFRWSHLHQYLLSDLLLTLDQDVLSWPNKSEKTALLDVLNDAENSIYVMNAINIVSHLSDVLITAAGGLLPLLSAATSASGQVDMLEPGYGLTIQNAVAYLLRVQQLADIMVMSSGVSLSELEAEKSMNRGTILRQCLRIVSTCVVRTCLECRRASGYYGCAGAITADRRGPAGQPQPAAASQALRHPDPVLALIEGARIRIGDQEDEPASAVDDIQKLFQDADLARLKAVLYRDTDDAKQTEWLVLATVYFISVLMVSKYRDLLEPSVTRGGPSVARHTTESGTPEASTAAVSRSQDSDSACQKPKCAESQQECKWHREHEGTSTTQSMYSDSDDDECAASSGTSLSVSVDVHSPASVRALPPSPPSSPSSLSTSQGTCDDSGEAEQAAPAGVTTMRIVPLPEVHEGHSNSALVQGAAQPHASSQVDVPSGESAAPCAQLLDGDAVPIAGSRAAAGVTNNRDTNPSTSPCADDHSASPHLASSKELSDVVDSSIRLRSSEASSQAPTSVTAGAKQFGVPGESFSIGTDKEPSRSDTEGASSSTEATSSNEATSGSTEETSGSTEETSGSTGATSGSAGAISGSTVATSGSTGATSGSAEATGGSADGTFVLDASTPLPSEHRSQGEDVPKSISSIRLPSASTPYTSNKAALVKGSHKQEAEETSEFGESLSSVAELPATAIEKKPSADMSSLSERLERALGTVAPVLKDILLEFSSFLTKRLVGSKGQELLTAGGLTAVRESHSAIELVMLLCSQEWQLSLQKHAGLAFIELVNEGRLLSHATRNHVVRVANEAEFILNKLRAEDVQKHSTFAAVCAQNTHRLKQEENTCDHLISSVKHRDYVTAVKIIAKANTIYWCDHASSDRSITKERNFWKLDAWEDDSRRRRRLVPNVVGSTHPEATLRAALEHGATQDAVTEARQDVLAYVAAQKRHISAAAAATMLHKADSLEVGGSYSDEGLVGEMPGISVSELDLNLESPTDPVVLSTSSKLVCLGIDIVGTLSVSRSEIFFEVDEEHEKNKKLDPKVLAYAEHLHGRWSFSDIYAIFGRKYLLQNTALEVFLSNRSSVMFAFPNQKIVKQVVSLLPRVGIGSKYGLPHTRQVSLAAPMQVFKMSDMMQKWRRREISNFDYLMFLNTVAGRTYCDVNQYPVFPWVLVNYDSDDIDLSQASNYRDLSRPVGALNPERKAYFEERFLSWEPSSEVPPFHYGTHYSNAAIVLGWLLRVEPYATMYLSMQGGKFDYPNRTFNSILNAWKSCQSDTADVKEVTPEFYSLPEMFVNTNRFKMGSLDNGCPVDDVILPPWAEDADDFVRICRQALESEIVSCQLHEWIDLIFGYKQRGPEAARATNVFYYLTYEGCIDLESIKDSAMRETIESQIRFFGQTPAQLLLDPHPPRGSAMHVAPRMFAPLRAEVCMILKFLTNSPVVHLAANTHSLITNPAVVSVFQNHTFAVNRWTAGGSLTPAGSGSTPLAAAEGSNGNRPDVNAKDKDPMVALPLGLDPALMAPNSHLRRSLGDNFDERIQLQHQHFSVTTDNRSLLACGFWDSSFRVFSLETGKVTQVIFGHFGIVTCLSHSEVNTYHDCYVVTGSRDCTCMVWQWSGTQQRIINSDPSVQVSQSNLVAMSTLNGHLSEIICCLVTSELGFVVSASADGACLMHSLGGDLLRSLERVQGRPQASLPVPPRALLVNREGYILSLYGKCEICLFSLSGRFLRHCTHSDSIKCLAMSSDGQYILTGSENGVLSVLRTHDLKLLYAYATCGAPIHDAVISHDQRYVMAGLSTGSIVVYNIDFSRWHHDYQRCYHKQ